MSYDIFKLKFSHENFYVLKFNLGLEIPFKLVSLEKYFYAQELVSMGRISVHDIEDKIFQECVLDEYYVKHENLVKLPAGVITTIAQTVLLLSGPEDANMTNYFLDENRQVYNVHTPLGAMFMSICSVFPYKVHELQKLTWQEIMSIYTLAESVLIEKGAIEQPLMWLTANDQLEHNQQQNQTVSTTKQSFNLEEDMKATKAALEDASPWDRIDRAFRETGNVPKPPPSPKAMENLYELQRRRQQDNVHV